MLRKKLLIKTGDMNGIKNVGLIISDLERHKTTFDLYPAILKKLL